MTVYLLVLNFRTPPFQTVFSHPNALKDTLITLDGFFSFAQHYNNGDWRDKYLTDLTQSINDRKPAVITSYLMPSIKIGKNLSIHTPYNTEIVFELDGDIAKAKKVNKVSKISGGSIRICLSKRSMIAKILLIKDSLGINIEERGLSAIQEVRGAYRDIFYDVQISRTNLLWCAIAKGDLKSINEFMKIALKTGIGKKRNMGWGDLKGFSLYKIGNKNSSIEIDEMLLSLKYRDGRREYIELLRPQTTTKVIEILKRYALLKCDILHGAVFPPYWRKNLVVSLAKFVKVL